MFTKINSSEVSCGSESVRYRSKNFHEACVVHDPLFLLCMIQNVNLRMWPLECGNTGKSENFKDVRIVLEGQHKRTEAMEMMPAEKAYFRGLIH